jgi:hypothetical protein
LARAADDAVSLNVKLEVAIFVDDRAEPQLESLMAAVQTMRPSVARWLVFHRDEFVTQRRWIELARRILARGDSDIPLGAGTNQHFTELNRQRPPVGLLDLACYPINPQVHAFDNDSLVETLEAQAATVMSARRFLDVPLAITPVTLRPRFNQHSGEDPPVAPGELPSSVDPRQMSLFGAAWTLGSLKYLAESGVATMTYYETTGWRGVLERETGSPLPARFASLPGSAFPLYHVLAAVGEFAGGWAIASQSSEPLQVEALILESDLRRRTILANMTSNAQTVSVPLSTDGAGQRMLDETTVVDAMRSPNAFWSRQAEKVSVASGQISLSLRPYATVVIDETGVQGSSSGE